MLQIIFSLDSSIVRQMNDRAYFAFNQNSCPIKSGIFNAV